MKPSPQPITPITEHPLLISWFCALQSNASYIEQQWQGTGSDFSDNFIQKAQELSGNNTSTISLDPQNPQPFIPTFDPNNPWQNFLLETFASALLSPKNHSKTLLSLDQGIDRLQISSFEMDGQHIHFVSLRGTDKGFLENSKLAIARYVTEKYTSFKHAAGRLIPLTNELLKDPPISAPVLHRQHPMHSGIHLFPAPSQNTIQTMGTSAPMNLSNGSNQHTSQSLNNTVGSISNPEYIQEAPLILFTGHSYGAALAHQMQKHYEPLLNHQAQVRSVGFGSPGFGQSTFIQTKSTTLNTAQMAYRGLRNLAFEGSTYLTMQGPWVAMSALVKRFIRVFKPDYDVNSHQKLEAKAHELINSKGRLDFINRFDPVPIIGSLAGNRANDQLSLEHGFDPIIPGLLGANHKMQTYVRSLTHSVLQIYPPQKVLADQKKQLDQGVHHETPVTPIPNSVNTSKVDHFLTHTYQQSIDICIQAQRIEHQSTQDAFESLCGMYPNEPKDKLLHQAKHIGLHSMCSFARGMLVRSGISQSEQAQRNLPEEPNSFEQMQQIDIADLQQEHSMKAALKAFNLRRHLKDLSIPIAPPPRSSKP